MIKNINILFVSHEPLTPSLKEMYSINELRKTFNVEFISLRSLYYKKNQFSFQNEVHNEEGFHEFSSVISFYSFLRNYSINNTYIFFEHSSVHLSSILIYIIIRKFKLCKLILYRSFISNVNIETKTLSQKVGYYLKLSNVNGLILSKLLKINYELTFATGKEKPLLQTNKFIPLNSVITQNLNYKKVKQLDYAVFIDQGFPTHPDLKRLGYLNNNAEEFINDYNNFFNYIEDNYNVEVVIAKHPKSSIKNELFNGRKIVVNQTQKLIEESKFVLAHFSLINNVAIAYYKPLILMYNNELKNFPNSTYQHISKLQQLLGVDLINLSGQFKDINLTVNKGLYNTYIDKYIHVNFKRNSLIIKEVITEDFKNIK